jgi:hypothetical protein
MQPPGQPVAQPPSPPPPAPPPPPGPRESKWLSTIGVLAVTLFVAFGGYAVAGEPSAAGDDITGNQGEPGEPIPLGPITIRPAPGWGVAEQIPDPPQLLLTNGTAQLYASVQGEAASAEALLDAYIQAMSEDALQLSASPARGVELPSEQPGVLSSYVGTFEGVASPLEGEVLALISPSGTPVLFDGWAPEGLWVGARDEVRTMISSAEIP